MPLHRELPPQDELLRPRDLKPIIPVPPEWWHCLFCPQPGYEGAGTTVEWMGPGVDGADGRCRECGQKYCLLAGLSSGVFYEIMAEQYPEVHKLLEAEKKRTSGDQVSG